MLELFFKGGPLFMSILTIILISMVGVAIINGLPLFRGKTGDLAMANHKISYIRSVGLFALIIGILGQLIGLFSVFQAIEEAGDITPGLVVSGFKVSMITTLYGFFIYVLSFLIWFGLSLRLKGR